MSESEIDELIGLLGKKYGKVAGRASEVVVADIPRISTGVFGLDYALGGGVPVGRITVFYGYKSSGKTTLASRVVGQAQSLCPRCFGPAGKCGCNFRPFQVAWIDQEGTYSSEWGKWQGVDNSRLLLVKPETAEAAVDIIDKLIRSGRCDLIVLDSIAALTPIKETEKSAEEWQQGLAARIVNKGIRRWVTSMNKVFVEEELMPTLLLINQIRMKIGLLYGDPATLPGGMGVQFASSIEVKFWSGKYEMEKDEEVPKTVEIHYNVTKNKVSVPRMEGSFKMYLREADGRQKGAIAEEAYMLKVGRQLGLIEKAGANWVALKEHTFSSLQALQNEMVSDMAFRREMHSALLSALLALS